MKKMEHISSVELNTTVEKLWEVLTKPEWSVKYMFNCKVISDFKVGSPIEWKGNYQGYEAHQIGTVLEIENGKLLKYTTLDPNSADPTIKENFIHVTYKIDPLENAVRLTIINQTFDENEERMGHIIGGWENIVLPEIAKLFNPE